MSPQAATAIQPVKAPVPVTQSATGDIFDRFQQTHDSIARRAFEIFNNDGSWSGHELEDWLRAESELLHPIRMEMAEFEDNLTVRAEVPGFSTKELDINVEPHKLTIAGRHQAQEENKKGKTIYSEPCGKEILRVVDLPAEVDSSKVSATLKDGVLNIELPKAAPVKAVRIEPNAA
jgi:HSP20 family protein